MVRWSAARKRDLSAADTGVGPRVISPAERRSSMRLRVAIAIPIELSVKGRPLDPSLRTCLDAAAGERHILRDANVASPGTCGDPVIRRLRPATDNHALETR